MAQEYDPGRGDIQVVGVGGEGGGGAVTVADGADVSLGARNATAATTDTGTFSLISLFKRLLEKLTAGLSVGGFTTTISATLTRPANTTAYAAGEEVTDTGGAILTLTSIARSSGNSGVIQGVYCAFSSNWVVKPALELWLYDTTSTPQTDNTAFAPADSVQDTGITVIPLNATYVGDATANTGNFAMDTGQISVPFKTVGSANLFLRVVVRNAAQAGANSDTLRFRFRVSQD